MSQGPLLEGKTALVTGAAGGQGAEICRRLAEEGANVLAIDVHPMPVATEVRERGRQAWELVLDLADRGALRGELPKALDALPSLDVVVCAAGVLSRRRLSEMDDDDWDRVMAVNLTAPVVITQVAWPYLQKSAPSSLVHITSTSPRIPMLGVGPAYMASKAGLWSLVTLFALEGASDGIRCNGIAPGPILTPMIEKDYPTEEIQRQQTPLGRIGKPADIAAAVVFLAAAESSFITGTILNVSGGKLWG
jgi:NAD(P)-dependent dehydrogenase (short-subunit alcohol dehydrogenase family)